LYGIFYWLIPFDPDQARCAVPGFLFLGGYACCTSDCFSRSQADLICEEVSDGHHFIMADFSAIKTHVAAWLAACQW
jgi:hypothetical protein